MKYLNDKLVTKKYIDDFIEAALIETEIINDTPPKNINANFQAVAEMSNYQKAYKLERSEFNVPWVRVLDNYNNAVGYPTPIAVTTKANTKYSVIIWIDTDRDIKVKLQDASNRTVDEKEVNKSDKPQRVTMGFTATGTGFAPKLFFEGDFKGIRFTKFAIERVV